MAKVSARGAHKLGQVTVETDTARYVYCLRSDGKVLRRLAGFIDDAGVFSAHPTGYKVWANLKPAEGSAAVVRDDIERLARIIERKRFGRVTAVQRH